MRVWKWGKLSGLKLGARLGMQAKMRMGSHDDEDEHFCGNVTLGDIVCT